MEVGLGEHLERIVRCESEVDGLKERASETHKLLEKISDKLEDVNEKVTSCVVVCEALQHQVESNAKKADFLPTVLLTAVITAAATGLVGGWTRDSIDRPPEQPQHSELQIDNDKRN